MPTITTLVLSAISSSLRLRTGGACRLRRAASACQPPASDIIAHRDRPPCRQYENGGTPVALRTLHDARARYKDNPTLAFERDLQLIEYTESLGFDEFWVGEHHSGGWETIPAPDIFLAAAAARTKRIRLGTAVINLPYHHPFHVAERMAFLDHLTYGRLMLGCGPGVLGPDMQLFDLDPRELRPMMNESVDIILKLYREDGLVYHEGDYWKIDGMEVQIKSYQQPHLPVYLTSSGSGNSVRVAAERGLPLISAVFTLPNAMPLGQQWDTYERVGQRARAPGR